jgi:hypothetical protein
MKTLILIEVIHRKPIPALANLIAGRAYTIAGVVNAEPFESPFATTHELTQQGFTLQELALGSMEVVRS